MTNKSSTLLSPRLQRLYHDIQSDKRRALETLWAEIEQTGSPVIEPSAKGYSFVTFLWKDDGVARQVAVIQDWGTDGIREHHMSRLPDTDVWYLTRQMRNDTRTTYQLSPSTSEDPTQLAPYQLDPLNPKTFTAYLSETGPDILFSLLELPEAPPLPWHETYHLTRGVIKLHQPFDDQRRFWVYLPPLPLTTSLPLLVV